MANRHGDYGSSRSSSREDQRRETRYGRDEERQGSGRSRFEQNDSPEVTGFGRNVSDEYRRQGGEWDADTDDRGSRRWSSSGDYGSYDEGRVQYGQRGGAQRGREYGQYGQDYGSSGSSDWDRTVGSNDYGQGSRPGWQGAQQGYGRDEDQGYGRYGRSSGHGRGEQDWGRGDWGQASQGGRGIGDRLRDLGRRAFGQHESGGRSRFGGEDDSREFGMGGSEIGLFRGGRGQMERGFRGRGPKGYERSDDRLREMICEMLTDDDDIDATEIEITVVSGEVTLDGTVDDRSTKHLVEDRIGNMSGVKDVRNQLRVKPQQQWGQSGQSDAQQSYQRNGQSGSRSGQQSGQASTQSSTQASTDRKKS